ncbi:TPA: hypothetical protein QHN36_003561 [Enterobacter bugandensis]|nr:hypothetical protein [Enterobacter bugandensis]
MRGQVMQIPLLFGDGRSHEDFDYTTNMPVNMLPVMRPLKGADGYMRMFPGVKQLAAVDGASRGVDWNTVKQAPYRVMGGKLYLGQTDTGQAIPGVDRTSMSHSRNSVAIVTNGTMIQVYYDGTRKNFSNWPTGGTPPNPTYNWGQIADVTWHRGRYVFSTVDTDTFWVSDLEDESHPDKISPAYRAESMPDGILAIKTWHDYILTFGSASIEFFGLTGGTDPIYANQPSYTTTVGIVGREAVTAFADTFAFVTSPSSGVVTVGTLNGAGGAWSDIGSNQIKKVLETYSMAELKEVKCESLTFRAHKLLIVHLPRHTLAFDYNASQANGLPVWSIIKTGINVQAAHTGIDFINEGMIVTCGDKTKARLGQLDETTSAQYGEDQEIILFTTFLPLENAIVNDFELDASVGGDSVISRLWISYTEDGALYSPEMMIDYNQPNQWLKRVLLRKIGRIRTALAFKIRGVGATPATLARARVRVS